MRCLHRALHIIDIELHYFLSILLSRIGDFARYLAIDILAIAFCNLQVGIAESGIAKSIAKGIER